MKITPYANFFFFAATARMCSVPEAPEFLPQVFNELPKGGLMTCNLTSSRTPDQDGDAGGLAAAFGARPVGHVVLDLAFA